MTIEGLASSRQSGGETQLLSLAGLKEARRAFLIMTSLLVLMGGFATWAIVHILGPIPGWWTHEPGWLDVVVFLPELTFAGLWFSVWFEGRSPVAVALTPAGISVRTRSGPLRTIKWTDPRLRLGVRTDGITGRSPRTTIVWGSGAWLPATGITPDSAKVLLATARDLGLSMEEREFGFGSWRVRYCTIGATTGRSEYGSV